MNWLDLVLCAVILLSVIAGFHRGLARGVFGFVASVLAVFLGFGFYRIVGAQLQEWGLPPSAANSLGFFLVFFGVLLIGSMVGGLAGKLLKTVGLGFLDRLGGGLLGFVRGIVVGIVIVMLLIAFASAPPPVSVKDSRLAPYLMEASNMVVQFAPRELRDAYNSSKEKLVKTWQNLHIDVNKKLPTEKY